MKKNKIFTVPFRRKREGRTNYKKRLALLLSNKPRLVVRRSLKSINAQIIVYAHEGDKVLVAANSSELAKRYGWSYSTGNIPAAYLTGLMIGKKASKKQIKEAVLDIGLYKSVRKNRIYALLKGAVEAGMDIPHSEAVLPDDKRASGEHIKTYADKIKKEGKQGMQFSACGKKTDVSSITDKVKEIKKKILEE